MTNALRFWKFFYRMTEADALAFDTWRLQRHQSRLEPAETAELREWVRATRLAEPLPTWRRH